MSDQEPTPEPESRLELVFGDTAVPCKLGEYFTLLDLRNEIDRISEHPAFLAITDLDEIQFFYDHVLEAMPEVAPKPNAAWQFTPRKMILFWDFSQALYPEPHQEEDLITFRDMFAMIVAHVPDQYLQTIIHHLDTGKIVMPDATVHALREWNLRSPQN